MLWEFLPIVSANSFGYIGTESFDRRVLEIEGLRVTERPSLFNCSNPSPTETIGAGCRMADPLTSWPQLLMQHNHHGTFIGMYSKLAQPFLELVQVVPTNSIKC